MSYSLLGYIGMYVDFPNFLLILYTIILWTYKCHLCVDIYTILKIMHKLKIFIFVTNGINLPNHLFLFLFK